MQLFYVYSHRDEGLRNELETHLTLLRRQGVISEWHDRKLVAGQEWEPTILMQLEAAQIVLLLVSSDFLASEFAYGREMKRALERHEIGHARVVPIMLRECDCEGAPFAKLQALPRDAFPVTSWDNRDSAWTSVAKGIRQAVQEMSVIPEHQSEVAQPVEAPRLTSTAQPPPIELLELRHKVTEQNATWWRFSWLADVRNNSDKTVQFDLSVAFLDDDGFVLDTGGKGSVQIDPHETRTVREYNLISTPNAVRVRSLSPSLRVRGTSKRDA